MLYIETKTDFLFFDSFGIDGLKNFIIQDDRKIIEKIIFGTDQVKKANHKITLVNIKFNLALVKIYQKKELDALTDTGSIFFSFHSSFRQQALAEWFCKYMDGRR